MIFMYVQQEIQDVFRKIEQAKNVALLKAILKDSSLVNQYPLEKYPRLPLYITNEDLEKLKTKSFLIGDSLAETISERIEDPLAKILYALAWKNGDLQKIKHIVNGISNTSNEIYAATDAIVFKQFGLHLANKQEEPIIDQHILRAFALYQNTNLSLETKIRKQTIFKNWSLVEAYKLWLNKLPIEVRKHPDGFYLIDQLLFSLRKYVKLK